MALIQKFGDSNYARPTGNMGENTEESKGEPAMMGYVVFPFPNALPATKNSDVTITKDLNFTMVNQGTSVNTYQNQEITYSSESGEGDGPSKAGPSPQQYTEAESLKEEQDKTVE